MKPVLDELGKMAKEKKCSMTQDLSLNAKVFTPNVGVVVN